MAKFPFPFIADANAIGAAQGQTSNVMTGTFTFAQQGVGAAANAVVAATAQSSPGATPPASTAVDANASALGGNISVFLGGAFSSSSPTSSTKVLDLYSSTMLTPGFVPFPDPFSSSGSGTGVA